MKRAKVSGNRQADVSWKHYKNWLCCTAKQGTGGSKEDKTGVQSWQKKKNKKKNHQDLLEGETGLIDDAKKNQKKKVILQHRKDITAYQVTY